MDKNLPESDRVSRPDGPYHRKPVNPVADPAAFLNHLIVVATDPNNGAWNEFTRDDCGGKLLDLVCGIVQERRSTFDKFAAQAEVVALIGKNYDAVRGVLADEALAEGT